MAKAPKPEIITITETEVDALLGRLDVCNLNESDKKLMMGVLKSYLWLRCKYESGKIGFHKLATLLFGKKTEKSPSNRQKSACDNPAQASCDADASHVCIATKEKAKGHGRLSAFAYQTAQDVLITHPELKVGDLCPEKCGGRLYEREPGILLRIQGQPLATVIRYHIQRLRCSTCNTYVHTPLPDEARQPKYNSSFKALLAVQKYFVGVPFHRQEQFLKLIHLPLSDATQWQLIEELARCVFPVLGALEILAAQGELISNDDTPVKILEVIKANQADPNRKRKGMATTGIYARVGALIIVLYYSGVLHAGENLSIILAKRNGDLPLIIHMCDALSHNLTPAFKVLLAHCLAHARRYFKDLEVFFPAECQEIIQAFGLVYHYESKTHNLSQEERLAYHQQHSQPIMEKLHAYLLTTQPLHEPNGDLYKAMSYLLKHWQELTLFLRVAGAPLDNNRLEAALKIPVRVRKNSLFHRSCWGAQVAGLLMSLIQTCRMTDINPIDYLVALQDHAGAVSKDPSQWLPWNYQKTLLKSHPPPASKVEAVEARTAA